MCTMIRELFKRSEDNNWKKKLNKNIAFEKGFSHINSFEDYIYIF